MHTVEACERDVRAFFTFQGAVLAGLQDKPEVIYGFLGSLRDQNYASSSNCLDRERLIRVHSQVLQNVVDRLDKAFQAFFRRCKAGEKPGFPRFRGVDRYHSLCYPQSGFSLLGAELKLSKIGCLCMKLHRPIQGEIKTCTLRKNASGDWTVSFSCEVNVEPQTPKEEAVGIDVGLTHFAVLSNGKKIPNPRFFRQGEKTLAKVQRKLATLKKGTLERQKQKKVVSKVHEHILLTTESEKKS